MTNILEASGLVKRFDDRVAVNEVSFHISERETYGLLGPNGAGKTTAISMICGLLSRDGGSVTIGGEAMEVGAVNPRKWIGYVPQDLAIYPDLTARENLAFFGRLYGLDKAALGKRVDAMLELTELTERADDRTKDFSGGMKRRLNIGIGLLHEPRLLVLDEPTVGVDPQSRNAILASVERLSDEGMAVLYTTHYMEEAERLCDRVGIIDEGSIRAEGTRRELVALVGETDKLILEASGHLGEAADRIGALEGVISATAFDGGIEVIARDVNRLLPAIIQVSAGDGLAMRGVEVSEPDLEAVFLHLTGKALRD